MLCVCVCVCFVSRNPLALPVCIYHKNGLLQFLVTFLIMYFDFLCCYPANTDVTLLTRNRVLVFVLYKMEATRVENMLTKG